MNNPDQPARIKELQGAYPPAEIAHLVEVAGVRKAEMDALTVLVLAILAGAYISLGALFYTVLITGGELPFGISRLIGGLGFCLGLVLVVIGGAELFTGNNLIAVAWASKRISTRQLAHNWLIAYLGNVIGCAGTVLLVLWSDIDALNGGAVGETAISIAQGKANLSFGVAFARGILCNAMVCLAVWLTMGGRSLADKVIAILFPVTAFVAMGFEHSIANWFFLPYGMALDAELAGNFSSAMQNIIAVTLGNMVGGTILVSGIYWLAYLRKP